MFEINMKNLPHILLVMGFFMLVVGCGSSYISGLQNDHKKVNKRMHDVTDTYKEFTINVKLFNEERDILHKTTLSNTYYDVFYTNDKGIKNSISNYEAMLDEINKKVVSLDNLCADVYYVDKDINNNCKTYKEVYEKVNNIFINDVKDYNNNVYKYNQHNEKQLGAYETKKKYIDYNKDNKFDGK